MKRFLIHVGWSAAGVAALYACGDGDSSFRNAEDSGAGGAVDSSAPSSGGQSGAGGSGGSTAPDASAGGSTAPDGGTADGASEAAADIVVCTDGDNDGQTDCDGDCDDADPQNYVGNAELCGDLTDNDCSGEADEAAVCGGLGTFVSALTGMDGDPVNFPGTTSAPVASIAQGIANALVIAQNTGGPVNVFVAEGTYQENVALKEGISLLGGFSCSAQPCSWTRNPSMYTSTIQAKDLVGVVADDTITRVTRFDGFRVEGMHGDGSGVEAASALRLLGGSPTVTNNTIVGGNITGGSPGVWPPRAQSIAVLVLPLANDVQGPLIDSNTLTAGSSANHVSSALSLQTLNPPAPQATVFATVTRNTIRGGRGYFSETVRLFASGGGTRLRNNDIFGGEATSGASWAITGSAQAEIDANRINTDRAAPPLCPPTAWCGGIRSESMTATITNNVIFGAQSEQSAAVYLGDFEQPRGAIVLNGNYLDGAGVIGNATAVSVALVVASGPSIVNGTVARIGRVRNNILVGGQGGKTYGVFEADVTGPKQHHPAALTHNDFFLPGAASGSGTHVLYRRWTGTAGVDVTDIATVNTLGALFGVPVTNNFDGDPQVDASFHLQTGSLCENAGTSTDAPAVDFEGDTRPQGTAVDVGADEMAP